MSDNILKIQQIITSFGHKSLLKTKKRTISTMMEMPRLLITRNGHKPKGKKVSYSISSEKIIRSTLES